MPGSEFDRLYEVLLAGRGDGGKRSKEEIGGLLQQVFEERYHVNDWGRFKARVNLSGDAKDASFAGIILDENPDSGAYAGTSLVWFPSERGSVVVLVIGTGGFGSDAHVLARPGHRRRLRALQRFHRARVWVKPDFLDLGSRVPEPVWRDWPSIDAALRAYDHVIYAAVPVMDASAKEAVGDLLDLFAYEHFVRFKGSAAEHWETRRGDLLASLFPRRSEDDVAALLEERRFVVLQGPPGTGKTRLALRVAERFGAPTKIQFHPARTYEDFIVGLAPRPTADGLAFEVREGDLLRANEGARGKRHVLVVDEMNRGDLARVLGEAIFLFEPGEPDRSVRIPAMSITRSGRSRSPIPAMPITPREPRSVTG